MLENPSKSLSFLGSFQTDLFSSHFGKPSSFGTDFAFHAINNTPAFWLTLHNMSDAPHTSVPTTTRKFLFLITRFYRGERLEERPPHVKLHFPNAFQYSAVRELALLRCPQKL